MNDQRERLEAALVFGGGAGAVAWALHGIMRVLGLPRLLAYVAGGATIAYVIDVLTTRE